MSLTVVIANICIWGIFLSQEHYSLEWWIFCRASKWVVPAYEQSWHLPSVQQQPFQANSHSWCCEPPDVVGSPLVSVLKIVSRTPSTLSRHLQAAVHRDLSCCAEYWGGHAVGAGGARVEGGAPLLLHGSSRLQKPAEDAPRRRGGGVPLCLLVLQSPSQWPPLGIPQREGCHLGRGAVMRLPVFSSWAPRATSVILSKASQVANRLMGKCSPPPNPYSWLRNSSFSPPAKNLISSCILILKCVLSSETTNLGQILLTVS